MHTPRTAPFKYRLKSDNVKNQTREKFKYFLTLGPVDSKDITRKCMILPSWNNKFLRQPFITTKRRERKKKEKEAYNNQNSRKTVKNQQKKHADPKTNSKTAIKNIR